eukprot:COSAG02_NODE_381_length_23450_cov_65.782493_8_plen_177_part_00
MQVLGWAAAAAAAAAASSSDNEEDTSDADEWDFVEDEGDRGARIAGDVRRHRTRAPSPGGSSGCGHASTEDESLDDTGSDSEEDVEESRRLKWKRCRRHRPPMMELWAAVSESTLRVLPNVRAHVRTPDLLHTVLDRFRRRLRYMTRPSSHPRPLNGASGLSHPHPPHQPGDLLQQ